MLQVVSSRFTIFYILNRTLLLLIPVAFVLAPFYVIFFENKSRYDTVIMPIVILSIFVGIFVYVFLKAYSLIRIEIYPHAIRFNNLVMMKGLQYKYSDIDKLQIVSQVTVGVQGRKGGWYGYTPDINTNPGFIIYFKDNFQIEITAETYSNTKEMLDCIRAMIDSRPSANLEIL
ncbi:MAG: hypothetical protein KA797_07085 [Chitinophagales bacterium]|nr:hypothetical protein [Chitinophagales bacterium]